MYTILANSHHEIHFDLFDSYGQTSYLNVIAYVQLLVGPAPYGVHLLNSTLFTIGAVMLHRLVRKAFGPVPAMATLAGVLFFPTLLVWSVSGLKESLNALVVTCVTAEGISVRNDVLMERRANGWTVVGYSLRPGGGAKSSKEHA